MIHIKRFIDKVTHMESRSAKDLVLPGADARGLRDEVAKLLADICKLQCAPAAVSAPVTLELVGGKF